MEIVELDKIAAEIREDVVKMLVNAGSGHSAGAMGMADVMTALYLGGVLQVKPDEPEWEERDRLILSAGHLAPVLYATLARAGFFPKEELDTLRVFGSRLQGHPHHSVKNPKSKIQNSRHVSNSKYQIPNMGQDFGGEPDNLPGVEATTGSLGHGVGLAVGLALGLRRRYELKELGRSPRVICVGSDGELQEGQAWEAFMTAAKYKLEQLTFVIDRNHIQIGGYTEEVMPMEPLRDKLEAFGLFVIEVDGHNIRALMDVFNFDQSIQSKPVAIIAHTVPGKGVSFIEDLPEWHGKPAMGKGEAVEALRQLRTLGGKIVGGT